MFKDCFDGKNGLLENKYKDFLCQLVSILSGNIRLGFSDEDVRLETLLKPISSKDFVYRYYDSFCGRREAFEKFAKRANGLTATYVSSFTDACEDTAADLSQFCILPIENNAEGILTSISSLIGRYELFIAGVCEITRDGHSTKFALLCPDACDIIIGKGRVSITLRLYGDGDYLMSNVYLGASFFGVTAGGSVSVPLGYTDGYASVCTFSGAPDTLFAFLLYLGVMKIGYTLVGAYNVIE